MTPQQREYCKAKAGLPFVVDYILGNNHPTVKWFKRQVGDGAIPDDMIARQLLERDEQIARKSEPLTTDDYNWIFGTGRFAQ